MVTKIEESNFGSVTFFVTTMRETPIHSQKHHSFNKY